MESKTIKIVVKDIMYKKLSSLAFEKGDNWMPEGIVLSIVREYLNKNDKKYKQCIECRYRNKFDKSCDNKNSQYHMLRVYDDAVCPKFERY